MVRSGLVSGQTQSPSWQSRWGGSVLVLNIRYVQVQAYLDISGFSYPASHVASFLKHSVGGSCCLRIVSHTNQVRVHLHLYKSLLNLNGNKTLSRRQQYANLRLMVLFLPFPLLP